MEVLRGKETKKFTFQMTADEKQEVLREHMRLFARIKTKLEQEEVRLLVLDEVIGACNTGVFKNCTNNTLLPCPAQRILNPRQAVVLPFPSPQ